LLSWQGKNGPKLQASPEGAKGPSIQGRRAANLHQVFHVVVAQSSRIRSARTVIDETGVKGDFDFKLEFAPDENAPASPARFMNIRGPRLSRRALPSSRALQEQLGLRLEGKRVRSIVVVDKPRRPRRIRDNEPSVQIRAVGKCAAL